MKTQKRTFVVEVKSSRRPRSVNKPQSIWGNTDLSAIAREIDAPSFGPGANDSEAVIRAASELSPEDTPEVINGDNGDGRGLTGSMSAAAADRQGEGHLEAGSDEQNDHLTAEEVPAISKTSPATRKQKRTKTVEIQAASVVTATVRADDDLATLEEDNQRLKGMWRHRLIEENNLLRMMLTRFID